MTKPPKKVYTPRGFRKVNSHVADTLINEQKEGYRSVYDWAKAVGIRIPTVSEMFNGEPRAYRSALWDQEVQRVGAAKINDHRHFYIGRSLGLTYLSQATGGVNNMKDKHAKTHVFTLAVTCGFSYEIQTTKTFERENGFSLDHVPNIFDAIGRLNEDGELPCPFYYSTPDYMDAILALFVLVEKEFIDVCTANETAMRFTEAFYGIQPR